MGGFLFLVGIGLAGYTGYSGLDWYFIFAGSLLMAAGYFIIRVPAISRIVSEDGIIAASKLLIIQVVMYSLVTAPIYFAAAFFS